ncbi:MAG: hypothetical protein MK171_12920 [Pirellulales bacterium]|nr:hypothetical protein [Pirellulales bacterium]
MSKKWHENTADGAQGSALQSPPRRQSPPPASELAWHPLWRFLVSLLVAGHLLAVFVAPWDLATGPALPPGYMPTTDSLGRPQRPAPKQWQEPLVTRSLRNFFNHYLNLLYLNHGYEFFAPDPVGTHEIDYHVTRSDGQIVEGTFPDLSTQWPRLYYHRHMMLAEQSEMINNQLVMMAEQTGVRKPFSGQVFAEHLATLHGGRARLKLKIHMLLSPDSVLAGTRLDDPSTYRLLGTVDGSPRPDRSGSSPVGQSGEAPITIPGAGQ